MKRVEKVSGKKGGLKKSDEKGFKSNKNDLPKLIVSARSLYPLILPTSRSPNSFPQPYLTIKAD
jgi:hypothetical protein